MTAFSPFVSTFLAWNLLQVIDDDIDVMLGIRFLNMSYGKCLMMSNIQFILTMIDTEIWIAPTEQIRVLAFQLQSNFA